MSVRISLPPRRAMATATRPTLLILLPLLLAGGAAWAHGTHAQAPLTGREDDPRGTWLAVLRLLPEAHAAGSATLEVRGGYRYVTADGLPDHPTGNFPNANNPNGIRAQDYKFRMPATPERAGSITPLPQQPFGVALNGIPFDPFTAEFYNNDPSSGWKIDALGGAMNLGLDQSNAHVQPGGGYHYHGVPTALLQREDYRRVPVLLGYAADGFPIYGPYGYSRPKDAGSPLVKLRTSYRLKHGTRPNGPGGAYDGKYVEDWEYADGLGQLDKCNGRMAVTPELPKGGYHYVITDAYPYIPRCFAGTPDASFERKGPPGGGTPGMRRPPPGQRPPPGMGRDRRPPPGMGRGPGGRPPPLGHEGGGG